MNKRVAVVVSHPVQHFVPQYSSWAKLAGVDLKVFFSSRRGLDAYLDKDFDRELKWDQLVMDFPHEFLSSADGLAPEAGADSLEIDSRLAKYAPDAVVVYGYSQSLQRRAVNWAHANSRWLAMIADSELRSKRSRFRRFAKAILLPRWLGPIDVFLTVGDANESYYRHYGARDDQLIRCCFPIDVKEYDAARQNRQELGKRVRGELGIPPGNIVILMVGKLVPWKRQVDLVRFSNSIQKTRQDVTVILAGSGKDESALRAEAANTGPGGVLFAGFVSPAKLVEYYAAADVYAHCAEVEPHSLAISEAIYSGLPVVLSDRCGSYGPSDDVRPGLNGLVYPCGEVDALSIALLQVIDRPELRLSMGRESEEIALANQALSHGKALKQMLELLALKRGTAGDG